MFEIRENKDPKVTELANQPDRETRKLYCQHCDDDQMRAKVYPYEFYALGYLAESYAYVCLKCENW